MLCALTPYCAVSQTVEVRIEQADEIARNPAVVDGQRLIGDVRLSVDGAVVHCDSAWRYTDGRFQMMGEVRVEDGPMALFGRQLTLHPDSGVGTMTGPQVRLVDRSEADGARTLVTKQTIYDFREGVARYAGGGEVRTQGELITSEQGRYQRDSGRMDFMGEVDMVVDTLTVSAERVGYLPKSRRLLLTVPTEIRYPSGGVDCARGEWDLEAGGGWFVGDSASLARFRDGDLVVTGDSLALTDSLGVARGRVLLTDTVGTYRLGGNAVDFEREADGEAGQVAMRGEAFAWLNEGDAPLLVQGPTITIATDSALQRTLFAGDGAALYSDEVTGAAEQLAWSEREGRVDLEGAPVLWSGSDQLTGDSVRLFLRDGAADRLEVRGHAFVASPAAGGFFHQIAGRDLEGTFSESGLEEVAIFGNGRTLYFADPDSVALAKARADSLPAPLPQANRAACSEILMRLDSAGLSTITLLQAPTGDFADLAALAADPIDGSRDAASLPGLSLRLRPDSARTQWMVASGAIDPAPNVEGDIWSVPLDSLRPKGVDPIAYQAADSIVFEVRKERVALWGNAKVETAGIVLEAARVDYLAAQREIEAEGVRDSTGAWMGRPLFTQEGKSFTQDALRYDLDSRKGISRKAITTEGELTFHADRAKRFPDGRIFLRGGKFTTCDAERPHFHFHLTRGLLVPDKKVVSGPMFVKVRKIPLPIGLPFFWFPQKQERSRGLIFPSFGNGRELGYFIKDLGWYEPLGDHWDARVQGDLYSRGTWRVAGTAQYRYRYRFNGNLQLSRSSIVSGGTAGDPDASRRTEFFVRWSHSQDPKARPNGRFNANVNFGSSGNFRSQLNSSQEDFLSNTFSSSINYNASLPGKPVSLTATARHNQNSSTGRVDLVVPSVGINVSRFELPISRLLRPNAVTKGWYDRIGMTYALKTEQRVSGADTTLFEEGLAGLIERAQSGIKHTASASTQIKAGFVSFTPNVSYNGYWNFDALNKAVSPDVPDSIITDTIPGFYMDGDWRMGVSANTKFYGTFENRGEGRLRAIRHVITPQVGFSYNPAFNRRDTLVGIDGAVLEVYDPLAPGLYTPAELNAQGALNFTLNNNLEAKVRDKDGEMRKVRLIDNLSLRASHNLQADSLRWSDITGSGFTTLAGKFPVNIGFAHSVYARDSTGATIDRFLFEDGGAPLRLKRANASVNGSWTGQGEVPWSLRAGYTMRLQRNWRSDLQADTTILTQNVTFNGNVTLFEDWRITVGSGYDFKAKEFTNTQVNVMWDLHCWEFSARWVPFGVQQSLQLRLAVKASMLRDVKVEKRFQGSGLIR